MSLEAMKQALEALEQHGTPLLNHEDVYSASLIALRQAIEAAEKQEPLTDEMAKQMKERYYDLEMRGAFADGWINAESAHGIKEERC